MPRIASAREMFVVRLCAYALAVAATALALVALSRSLTERASAPPVKIADAIEVVITRAKGPPRRFVRAKSGEPVVMAAAMSDPRGRSVEAPGLWTYDEAGRIVFTTREQLQRCVSARRLRREAADCPNSRDRRAMISRDLQ